MKFISLSLMLVGLALGSQHKCHPKKIVHETLPVNVTSASSEVASLDNTQVAQVAPVEASPVEVAPVEPSPVEVAPAESSPVEAAPVESSPVEVTPAEPSPVEAAPVESPPVEVTPAEPSPVEVAPAEPSPVNDTCPVGTWQQDSLGMHVLIYDNISKNMTALEEQPSTCQTGLTRCDFEKVGVYHDCIDNKWVEKKCRCPGQTCSKGAMFAECRGTVTKA